MTSGSAVAMPRRPVVLGVFTFVILAVAIASVATGSWYWAVATEALIVIWFTIALVMPRTWRNSGRGPER
jgi:glucose dehydrogenase